MSYYRTCPRCGAHLDPGEACDCQINDVKDPADAEEVNQKENNAK